MGALSEIYVDPAGNANSGSGTIGDPYLDLQHALNTHTRDSTNGDRFNIKSGTDEALSASISLATYGTPGNGVPLVFQGYTSAAGDGGIGGITGGGSVGVYAGPGYVTFKDLHLHNCGSVDIIDFTMGFSGNVIDCELDNTTGTAIEINLTAGVYSGNNIYNIGSYGIDVEVVDDVTVYGNYFKNGTNDFVAAIRVTRGLIAFRNIISIDGSSIGIDVNGYKNRIIGNSIFSAGGTGEGIDLDSSSIGTVCFNNLVEGFSGTGGDGITLASGNDLSLYGGNAVYNCTTNYNIAGDVWVNLGDNETLSASPFAKSGADTFANRFGYFAPVDTGNVIGGAYPSGSDLDKGAVQAAAAAASGGGIRLAGRGGLAA